MHRPPSTRREAYYRQLLDSAAEAIFGLDTDGRCTFANAACVRLLGYDSADALIDQPMHELIHGRHADGSAYPVESCPIYQAFLSAERCHVSDEVMWRRDGTAFPAEYWSYPVMENGEVIGAVVTFLDITDRREREQLLERQNQALRNLNRMSRALASNLELDELLEQITQYGRELTGAEFGAFFYNTEDAEHARYELESATGVDASHLSQLPMPRATALFGPTFRGEGVIRLDDVTADPRFGLSPPYNGLPEGHPPVRSYLAAPVISRDGTVYGGLFFGHGQPGMFDARCEQMLLGLTAQATVALDNAQLYETLQQELVERRDAERRLQQAYGEAEAASRAKSEFLANMSHEIRTPMTAILGYVDLLLSQLQADDQRRAADTIRRNGEYLLEILNDLLDLSKIEAGKLELHTEPVSPTRLLVDVASLLDIRAQDKGITLDVNFDSPLPDTVVTDPTRLRQVLVNLIGNAIKFTDEGSVTLRMGLVEDGAPRLRFDVSDTGVGMSAEVQARIFEPFSQGDTSMTRATAGAGLGLAICRRLVTMLGGDIWVDSEPGAGATFSFTIDPGDLSDVALVEPVAANPGLHNDATDGAATIEGRVLVVDDHPEIRELAAAALRDCGASVVLAGDGVEALEAVAEAEAAGAGFDAVVMDMQMPRMSGYEATRRLRDRGFDRPVIALTASAMDQDRLRCLEAGCDEHVAKPARGHMLARLVANHIRQARTPAEQPRDVSVLLVEDADDARAALHQLLELRGYRVQSVSSGAEAIEAACAGGFDSVLLDLGLPDMTGYQVLEALRSSPDGSSLRVIALTGRNSRSDRDRTADAGFDGHLVKPASLAELEACLSRET